MRKSVFAFTLFLFTTAISAQESMIKIKEGPDGIKLSVNGKDFFINGMNWDYFPIGTNYSYSLWH